MVFVFEGLVLLCHLSGLWQDAAWGCIFCTVTLFICCKRERYQTELDYFTARSNINSYNAYRIMLTFRHVCVFL